MALPDTYEVLAQGTAIIWGDVAAPGVTANMGLNNLANNAGRMGVAVDLGATFQAEYEVHVWIESGTAPTALAVAEIYLASSYDNAKWPGQVSGADAAYPATINTNKVQLGPPAIIASAFATANTLQPSQPVIWCPPARYVVPVLLNWWGQTIRNTTAANNLSRIILVPITRSIID